MRKTTTRLTKTKINGARYYCVIWPKIGRGRNRQFFKSTGLGKDDAGKRGAEEFLKQKLIEQENYGTAGLAFNETQRAEYREATAALKSYGKCIRDAVAFYLPHLQATNRTCTATELAAELIKIKKSDGASERYIGDLRSRLKQFATTFEGKPVAEITATEIDHWLRSLSDSETGKPLAATTRNNFRRILIVAFNFARDRGYCVGNPAQKSAKAKAIESPVGILTVDETARLLKHAPAALIPYIAIGAFAGLRRSELEGLDWSEIDLQEEEASIDVSAKNAKSARRRSVHILPNLIKWLRPNSRPAGPVTPENYRELLDQARSAAGIKKWPHNALRHGFASYHYAHFKDAPALAADLGHTNSYLVFQHYRQVVRRAEAKRYWNIVPESKGTKIVPFKKVA
jgi:integrase